MTTNPPGNDAGTPIHDRTAAADGIGRPVDPLDALPLDEQLPPAPSDADRDASPYGSDATVGSVGTGHTAPSGIDTGSGTDGTSAYLPTGTGTGFADGGSSSTGGDGKADAAKGAAQDVAGDAKEKAANVAGTAKEQAANVASELSDHAKQVYGEASENLKQQAADQQQRAAGGLRSIGEQLGRMAENDDEQGVASKVVRDLSHRATSVAGYLEDRDPGSLLGEVKSFAAKRPGTFIAVAAGAGILAGRLAKALATEVKHEKEAEGGTTGTGTGA